MFDLIKLRRLQSETLNILYTYKAYYFLLFRQKRRKLKTKKGKRKAYLFQTNWHIFFFFSVKIYPY